MNTATINPTAESANTFQNLAALGGRVLLAALFLVPGVGTEAGTMPRQVTWRPVRRAGRAAAAGHHDRGAGCAAAIIVGWKTRIVAFLLAGFTLLSALIFHNNCADQISDDHVPEEPVHRRWIPAAGRAWCGSHQRGSSGVDVSAHVTDRNKEMP